MADAGQGGDGGGVAAGVAAHDHQGGFRVGLVQAADGLPALGVALVRHRAGVDHAQLGPPPGLGLDPAGGLQQFLDVLRLVLVDLAAERRRREGARGGHVGHSGGKRAGRVVGRRRRFRSGSARRTYHERRAASVGAASRAAPHRRPSPMLP